MNRILRALAALIAAAALVAGVGLTRSGSSSEQAHWVCVYVDYVHFYACQDKPIDFYPDDDDERQSVSNGAALLSSRTNEQ